MASVKFEKDGPEWALFRDFYQLCTKHWEVDTENPEAYFATMIQDTKRFYRENQGAETFDSQFVQDLVFATINLASRKEKAIEKAKEEAEMEEKEKEPEYEYC